MVVVAKRMGRPPVFKRRAQLSVFLEESEMTALYAAAKKADVSASSLARSLIIAGLRGRRSPGGA